MSKKNFLKKAFSKFIVLVLCFAVSIGMVACGKTTSSLSGSGTGTNAALTVWTHDGNVEKILQKRLTGESIDYSTYYSNKEFYVGVFQNETEASNIILTAGNKDISEYTIEYNDFVCGSNILPRSAFSVYNQKYIENVPREGIFGGGWYPDCLLPMDIAVIYRENFVKAGTHQAIYIAVTPDADQTPGIYNGSFTITADGRNYTVTAKVEVFDFMLPTEPIGEYAAGYSVDNLQAGELDTTIEMMETYYNFFLDFRCSPGNVPIHGSLSYGGFDAYMNEWIPQVRKYTLDERVGFINLPYSGNLVDITYETTKKDANGKIVYKTDANGDYILDEDGNKIPEKVEKTESHNVAQANLWVNMLRRLCEASFYDANGDGTITDDEFVNLFSKASTYFVYFDEFSSTAGKDLTAISTLQFVVYAATLVGDEYRAKWEADSTPELTENEQAVLDSMLSIKHRAISTTPAPLEHSSYVKKMQFDMKDNASMTAISEWTKNYKYYDEDGNLLVSYNGNRGTLLIQDFTECVFVTGITNYATAESRAEYHNYAANCKLYNHEKWVYTAENPKYPSVNNHLDTSLWGIRAMGWMQADWDANGNLYWSSTLCRQYVTVSPLYIDYLQDYYQTSERYRGTNGDGYVAYIGRPYETGPLASTRLHAIRDGNEDYDLLYYLEQYYIDSAAAKGVEYSDIGFKNVLHTMTETLYEGVKMINSTTDQTIRNARKLLADLLALGKNTGVVVENYEIIEDTVRFTISAPSDVIVKVNNQVQTTGNTIGSVVEYVISIPMSSVVSNVKISAQKDDVSASASFSIKSVASVVEAGSFGSTAEVLPQTVNRVAVDAGNTEVVNISDGDNQVSAIKGNFYSYYAYDVNGTHIKVSDTGDITVDYEAIDVGNTLIKLKKYTYVVASETYIPFARGTFIKGADGEYYAFANSDEDYADSYYGKLKRYVYDGAEYVFDMDGNYIKAQDGTFFEFDATEIDTTSTIVLSYSLVGDEFVEDSNGSYRLKSGGDIDNPDDFIKPMEGEENNRYKLGTDRHQLQFDVSSLNITAGKSLLSIKIYVEHDLEITVGGQVGNQVSYAATRFQLVAGQWNEIQIKPSALGATASRIIKLIRLRLPGVEENSNIIVGKIVVVN